MSKGTKAFAAFLLVGSAVMFFMNFYTLLTMQPLDLSIVGLVLDP